MKRSEKYLEVAEFIFGFYEEELAKDNISWRMPICPQLDCSTLPAFRTAFKPKWRNNVDRWYDDFRNLDVTTAEYNRIRDHRVFSLLIMHELAKDYEELLENSNAETTST